MTAEYDDAYRQATDYFGQEPDQLLVQFVDQIDANLPVLDIGSGQGRHALYLAQRGIEVDAIDPSEEAVQTLADLAVENHLPINSMQADFTTFESERASYGAVLVFGLIPILTWEQIDVLSRQLDQWTQPGSLAFITAFSTEDESLTKYSQQGTALGKNSLPDGKGGVRTYIEPGELPTLFNYKKLIHHWEGLGPEHRHGDGPLHRHAWIEIVLQY